MWAWIGVGLFLIVAEIILRTIPVLERRHLERPRDPPDWSTFSSYSELTNAMSEWHAGAEALMEQAMPRLLDLCFSEDNGPVRARSMEVFREWANGLAEEDPSIKQRARNMIVDRLEGAADQSWLLDVFDGKLSHHGAPRSLGAHTKSGPSTLSGA